MKKMSIAGPFKIEDQKLVRIFPIGKQGDLKSNPTGGRGKLVDGLVMGEDR